MVIALDRLDRLLGIFVENRQLRGGEDDGDGHIGPHLEGDPEIGGLGPPRPTSLTTASARKNRPQRQVRMVQPSSLSL